MNNSGGITAICVVLGLGFLYLGHCIEADGVASRKLLMALGTVVGDMANDLSDIQKHQH